MAADELDDKVARPAPGSLASPAAVPDRSAIPPAEQRVSFQVHRVNAKLGQVANVLFRCHGLDLISSRILVFLLEKHEMRVGELVDLMVLPQSTISHQLQRLDKRGLIRRRRTREDNRAVAVTLTSQGLLIARECNGLSHKVYRQMTDGLSEAEIGQLGALLRKVFQTLDAFEGGETGGAPAGTKA